MKDGLHQAENTANKVRQAQITASDLRQAQNLSGNLPNTGDLGEMGNEGGSGTASNFTSDLRSRGINNSEELRKNTYGHSTGRDDSRSGYGGHNANINQYGRDTNANCKQHFLFLRTNCAKYTLVDDTRNADDMGQTRSGMGQQSMSGMHSTQRMPDQMEGVRDENRNFVGMPLPQTGMGEGGEYLAISSFPVFIKSRV